MAELMECGGVEMRGILERGKRGQADVVVTGPVVCFAIAFPDSCSGARQELVKGCVPFIKIARLDSSGRPE
jgi:hypothetical protein